MYVRFQTISFSKPFAVEDNIIFHSIKPVRKAMEKNCGGSAELRFAEHIRQDRNKKIDADQGQ